MRELELTILGGAPEAVDKARLVEILEREIAKEVPDDELVLAILGELKRRDEDRPVELTDGQKKIWEEHERKIRKRSIHILHPLVRAAMVALALCALVLTVPTNASAGSLWKIVASWTADIFRYENIGEETVETEDVGFTTDNEGLQAVYDALGELGIEPRPVPRWLPEGYVLAYIKTNDTPAQKGLNAYFNKGEKELIISYKEMDIDLSPDYYKEDIDIVAYECNGIVHSMIENSETWTVNWIIQNLKCSMFIDCQEDVVKQIIKSIY